MKGISTKCIGCGQELPPRDLSPFPRGEPSIGLYCKKCRRRLVEELAINKNWEKFFAESKKDWKDFIATEIGRPGTGMSNSCAVIIEKMLKVEKP